MKTLFVVLALVLGLFSLGGCVASAGGPGYGYGYGYGYPRPHHDARPVIVAPQRGHHGYGGYNRGGDHGGGHGGGHH